MVAVDLATAEGAVRWPRIVCPYLAKENRFAIDEDFSFVGLTDTTVIFPTDQRENLKYLCAVLNARLLNLRFKGIGKLKSNGIREYFDNAVSQMPIRRISWKIPRTLKSMIALLSCTTRLQTLTRSWRKGLPPSWRGTCANRS